MERRDEAPRDRDGGEDGDRSDRGRTTADEAAEYNVTGDRNGTAPDSLAQDETARDERDEIAPDETAPDETAPDETAREETARNGRSPKESGLGNALGLTFASTVVWGIAHVWAGRRVAGFLLMALFAALIGGTGSAALVYRADLKQIAVQRAWLDGITAAILALALVWVIVVLLSYHVVRPTRLRLAGRVFGRGMAVLLALAVCAPLAYAADATYLLRDTITTIFPGDQRAPTTAVNAADPWKDRPRLNVLLIGGDGAGDRVGVRTDSMTVASIDTKTGNTVLFGLPRNLQHFPVIPRLRDRWPDGFTGVGAPGDLGLLNEMYQDAEDDPSLEPGYKKGQRGAHLLKEEISYLIGQPIDYYILVNLFGFSDIVDAMGGVTVHITKPLPIGGTDTGAPPTGYLQPGYRTLGGKDALWYGRSRHADSDYARMGRQKCLLRAIAQQADPGKVVTRFEKLAAAAKKTISTNIPADLLPALVTLSGTMKHGAQVDSLLFVPPKFDVVNPDVARIRQSVTKAIETSVSTPAPSPTPPVTGTASTTASTSAGPSADSTESTSPSADPTDSTGPSTGSTGSKGEGSKNPAVSLASACG